GAEEDLDDFEFWEEDWEGFEFREGFLEGLEGLEGFDITTKDCQQRSRAHGASPMCLKKWKVDSDGPGCVKSRNKKRGEKQNRAAGRTPKAQSSENMATIIKSYNGTVGRVYEDLHRYITSPNSSYLPDPLIGPQTIRMRKDLHYGQHDPLLMPQPFSLKTPHLPLIRRPDSTSDLNILCARPEEHQFDAIDGFKLAAQPIGHLLGPMVDALEHAYFKIIERMASWALAPAPSTSYTSSSSTPPLSSRSDPQVKSYRGQVSYLLGHLRTIPSSFLETRMIFAMCQRCCLELDARITWVQSVAPSWGQMEAWRVPKLREVVGAISSQPLIVESCFRSGIPVWYLRSLPVHPQIKVQHWHSTEKPVRELSQLIATVTSFKDEDPPYP
ncbi:hypothetical protein F5880DRAFT_1512651, partial [Lentinula raphanica]